MDATKKKPAAKKGCTCIAKVNEHLALHNTQLSQLMYLSGKTSLQVATEKVEPSKRGKAKTVVPTYCPFCGKKL